MVACTMAFSGSDSVGRRTEVAQSATGAWYYRQYINNGYAMAWSKWSLLNNEVTFADTTINKYDDNIVNLPAGQFINWGFNKLEKFDITPKFRLPA